jgi:hypothetical protein
MVGCQEVIYFYTLISDVQNYSFDTRNSMVDVSLGFKFPRNQKNK